MKRKLASGIMMGTMIASVPMTTVISKAEGSKITMDRIKKEFVEKGKKVDFTDNIGGGLPDGARIEVVKEPDTSVTGITEGEIKIIYKDGEEQTFKVPVEVVTKLENGGVTEKTGSAYEITKYQIKTIKVPLNAPAITNTELENAVITKPSGTKFSFSEIPSTAKAGYYTVKARATFPDNSTQDIEIPVHVQNKDMVEKERREVERHAQGEKTNTEENKQNKKEYKVDKSDIIAKTVVLNGKLSLTDCIRNLPQGSKVKELKVPATNVLGNFTGLVQVTFPDGKVVEVEIPVAVVQANVSNNGNGTLTPAPRTLTPAPIKGEAQKGEMVKTGDSVKKGIIGGVVLGIAVILGGASYFYKKKMTGTTNKGKKK